MAVIFLGGFSAAKYDAGGDGIGSLQVGVVEALDVLGESVQPQRLLQVEHHLLVVAVRIDLLALLEGVDAQAGGIAKPQVQQR